MKLSTEKLFVSGEIEAPVKEYPPTHEAPIKLNTVTTKIFLKTVRLIVQSICRPAYRLC